MRKKMTWMILSVLVGLAVLPAAHAQAPVPIAEIRQQAAEGWRKTYEAYGRTIAVDIPITVPQVDSVPVVICEDWKRFDEAWVRDMFPDPISTTHAEGYKGIVYPYPVQAAAEWKEDRMSIDIADDVSIAMSVNHVLVKMNQLYADNLKEIHRCFYPHELDLTRPCAEDNPMTVEEAAAFLSALLNRLNGEDVPFALHWIDTASRGRIVKSDSDEGEGPIAPYYPAGKMMLDCDQTFHGIPNIQRVWELLSTEDKGLRERLRTVEAERPGLTITDRDSWSFGASLKKEIGVVTDDIPIIGAQAVIDQLEAMILSGHIRHVYALELGYCMFLDPQTDGRYWLYPVWKCECMMVDDPEDEIRSFKSLYNAEAYRYYTDDFTWLVFGAQTGERMGKAGATAEDYCCPPILP